MTYLYALISPIDCSIYVGISKDVYKRFNQHWSVAKSKRAGKTRKDAWFAHILELGMFPTLVILGVYETYEQASTVEKSFVRKCYDSGIITVNTNYTNNLPRHSK